MIDKISFTTHGLEDYIYWQTNDKRILKKMNQLIKDILRNGNKNRLIYRLSEDNSIEIIQCRGHYNDK